MAKYTILHLDDCMSFIEEINFLLDKLDVDKDTEIEYIGVHTIEDAWKEIEKKLPHLLIVDLMLENDYDPQPGIDFIKEIREKKSKKLKIMVLTANTDKYPKQELSGMFDYYWTKAFRPSEFKQKVSDILREIGGNR